MIELKDLLLKYDHLVVSLEEKKEKIINIIQTCTNIPVDVKDVEIKGGTVYLNLKPIYKNQIFMKQEEIKTLIQSEFGQRSPDRIV